LIQSSESKWNQTAEEDMITKLSLAEDIFNKQLSSSVPWQPQSQC
jgi:hypothetical protein